MLKRLMLMITAIICFLPNTVYSITSVQVLILPFEIHSIKELSYLETEIPSVIKKNLERDGAIVLDLDDSLWKEMAEGIDGIKNTGIKCGADYVVYGSLTWIGQKFSLDAKMVESFGKGLPNVFFIEGEGIENLPGAVNGLAHDLGMKLFKWENVARVLVTGNKRIEADAIKKIIKTKPGDIYLAKKLSEDLKIVYSMGYFEDIRVETEDSPEGKVVIFKVEEKPVIRVIRIKGNSVYKDEEIKENLDIRTGSILNIFKIRSNIKMIEELYKDKNYHNVKISYNVQSLVQNQVLQNQVLQNQVTQNQADLEFVIEEGEKVRIKRIIFEGNSAYTNKKLKGMMKSSEKGFFSWLTSSGEMNMDDLNQDVARLSSFYHNNGYIQARVGEPDIEHKGNWINITIKIDEGPQFKVGKVDITGDMVLPKEELIKKLKIAGEKFYNREVVRNDVLVLTDLYSDEGYAYADIFPGIDKNFEDLVVNISYVIEKGKQVYFEKIIIGGNTKTRDKVIRRELKVYEQELYSGQRLKRGVRNLYRLDFFDDIKIDTLKGSSDDKMILKIDVTEKPTGAFSFGGGYSSVEEFFVMTSISKRNLFGRSQTLQLKGQWGGRTNKYTLSFTEPWMFDIPLSAGFDLYNWEKDYDTYDKDSKGGGIRLGYPVYDFTRAYLSYSYEAGDIRNITDDASDSVRDMEGINVMSSISAMLRYDSRDKVFNPSEGQDHSFTVKYAGIGGDIGFTKYLAEAGWYTPLFWNTVGFLHARGGYVSESSGKKLPDYEKFYLGGMNSLRGFDWHDISPVQINKDNTVSQVGGDKFVQFNIEFLIPLIKEAGLVGVVFYDTGNVYGADENVNLGALRKSAGYGFRWYSPMGPMRLENGYILDPEEGESKGGRWEFTMGAAF